MVLKLCCASRGTLSVVELANLSANGEAFNTQKDLVYIKNKEANDLCSELGIKIRKAETKYYLDISDNSIKIETKTNDEGGSKITRRNLDRCKTLKNIMKENEFYEKTKRNYS